MTKPADVEYVPVTREDVADDNAQMLANSLRALQTEMRAGFDLLGNRIVNELQGIRNTIEQHASHLGELDKRLTALEITSRRRPTRQK